MNKNIVLLPLIFLCVPVHGMLTALNSRISPSLLARTAAIFSSQELRKWIETKHDTIALALVNEADISGVDKQKQTLLHITARHSSDAELIEALVRNGINIDARDRSGNTALHTAYFLDNRPVIAALKKLGAKSTIKNDKGETPIDLAHHVPLASDPSLAKSQETPRINTFDRTNSTYDCYTNTAKPVEKSTTSAGWQHFGEKAKNFAKEAAQFVAACAALYTTEQLGIRLINGLAKCTKRLDQAMSGLAHRIRPPEKKLDAPKPPAKPAAPTPKKSIFSIPTQPMLPTPKKPTPPTQKNSPTPTKNNIGTLARIGLGIGL